MSNPRRKSGQLPPHPLVVNSYGAAPDESSPTAPLQRYPSPNPSTTPTNRESDSGGDGESSRSETSFESAQVRYARLKQRNQNNQDQTKINGSTPNNTSVNIATAFHQASGSTHPFVKSGSFVTSEPDSDRPHPLKETHPAVLQPRPSSSLLMPSLFQPNTSTSSSRSHRQLSPMPPPSSTQSQTDAAESRRRERNKSPVLEAVAGAARALSPVSYLLKPRVGGQMNSFIEDREDEDEGLFRSFSAALVSPSRRNGNMSGIDKSFLSATTQSMMDSSMSFDRSGESNYRFEEEERLMREMQEKRKAFERDGVQASISSDAGGGGWTSGLAGFNRGTSNVSLTPGLSSKSHPPTASSLIGAGAEDEFESSGTDQEGEVGDESVKSTRRRRPRVSEDNRAFKYRAGDSASENFSDSDEKRRRKKKGVEETNRQGRKTSKEQKMFGISDERNGQDAYSDQSTEAPSGYDYPGFEHRLDEDDNFAVQLTSKQPPLSASSTASSRSQPSRQILPHQPDDLPSPNVSATPKNLPLHIIRSCLVAMLFVFNTALSAASWLLSKPDEILRSLSVNSTLVDWKKLAPFLWGLFGLLSAAYLIGTESTTSTNPASPSTPTSPFSSWLPFFSPKQPVYQHPSVPPESLEELINRLSSLESALSSLSVQNQNQGGELLTRFSSVDDRLSLDLQRAFTVINTNQDASIAKFHTLDSVVGRIRGDVQALNTRMVDLDKQVGSGEKIVSRLDSKVSGVTKDLKSLDERVKEAEKLAKSAASAAKVAQLAADTIEAHLPSRLVVRMNPKTKSLDIDPAFWKALRAVFVNRKEVDSLVSSQGGKVPTEPRSSSSIQQTPSWEDFLSSNENALRSWTDSEFAEKVQSGVVVSRADFLDLLRLELEALKINLEQRVEDKTNDVLDKSLSAIKTANSKESGSSSTFEASSVSTLITSMIDSALVRYSQDTLAKTDYALASAGARVVPSITSNTYEIKPSRWGAIFGQKPIGGRPPITVLNPDIHVGNCWPFAGSIGQLGILLARPVVISEITIEHAARAVSIDLAAAPREIEIYGLPEGEDNRNKVTEYNAQRAAMVEGDLNTPYPQHLEYIHLGSFTYDIDLPNHIQTFKVPEEVQALGIKTGVIITKVKNNYGDDYTCLYRIRVHGDQRIEEF